MIDAFVKAIGSSILTIAAIGIMKENGVILGEYDGTFIAVGLYFLALAPPPFK